MPKIRNEEKKTIRAIKTISEIQKQLRHPVKNRNKQEKKVLRAVRPVRFNKEIPLVKTTIIKAAQEVAGMEPISPTGSLDGAMPTPIAEPGASGGVKREAEGAAGEGWKRFKGDEEVYGPQDVTDWSSVPEFNEWENMNEQEYDDYIKLKNQALAEKYGSFIKVKVKKHKLSYFCELCIAEMNAEKPLEGHCFGAKHLKKVSFMGRENKSGRTPQKDSGRGQRDDARDGRKQDGRHPRARDRDDWGPWKQREPRRQQDQDWDRQDPRWEPQKSDWERREPDWERRDRDWDRRDQDWEPQDQDWESNEPDWERGPMGGQDKYTGNGGDTWESYNSTLDNGGRECFQDRPGPPSLHDDEMPRQPRIQRDDRPRPPSIPRNDRPRPPSIPRDDRQRPPNYSRDDRPRPPHIPRDDRPRPPSIPRDNRQRPPSGPRNDRQRPPSIPRNDRQRPPSIPRNDRQRPPSIPRDERQRPGSHYRDERPRPGHHRDERSRPSGYHRGDRTRSPGNPRNDRSRPPAMARRDRSPSPSMSREQRSKAPPPPPISKDEWSQPPIISKEEWLQPPMGSNNERSQPPVISNNERSQPPIISKDEWSLPPSISKDEWSKPASSSSSDGAKGLSSGLVVPPFLASPMFNLPNLPTGSNMIVYILKNLAGCKIKSKSDGDLALDFIKLFLKPLQEYSAEKQDLRSLGLLSTIQASLESLKREGLYGNEIL